ncbi:unnamed protein product [Paramecium sonneborni]|uniref:Kinesin-like protein n=1 Tax=Paramecium sonneborni TaxID=65129 RepID=A0A8S1MQ45_9CILI|nr:unnamed protein product [Paramecium sonneborni]
MEGPKITVVIRKRPLGKKELARGDQDIVQVKDQATVLLSEIKQKVDLTKYVEQHHFNFDLAFDESVNNEGVYATAVRPIIEAAFNKAKCTCFAYGQTGSGKTFTMLGDTENNVHGLYLMASYDLFAILQRPEYCNLYVTISFYEIYCGKLFDLLNDRTQLAAQEDAKGNVQIKGLTEKKIQNVQQLMQIIQHGQNSRVTSQNSANSESSRSHALLQINLKQGKLVHGKLSFIDLAGSERGADVRDQDKTTRVDGAEINKSLLALKECIRALDLNKNHTPFRGSKLTLVLKDSLIGNCRTVMIGNISPSSANSEHTLNTLRYADRVKELKKPQDQKSGGDPLNRELMLARTDTNVIRREYRNPDSEEEEGDDLYSGPQGSQGSLSQMNNQKYQQSHNMTSSQQNQSQQQFQYGQQQQLQQQQLQQQLAPQSQPQQHPRTLSANSQQSLSQQQQYNQQFINPYAKQQQPQQQQPPNIPKSKSVQSNQQQQQQSSSQTQLPSQQFFMQQPMMNPQQQNIYQQQQQPNLQQFTNPQPQQYQPQMYSNIPKQNVVQQNPLLFQQQQNQFSQQQQLFQQFPQQSYANNNQFYQKQQPLIPGMNPIVQQPQPNNFMQHYLDNNLNQQQQDPFINDDFQGEDGDNLLLEEVDPEQEVQEQRNQILSQQHQELVNKVLQEEDEIIVFHRDHIDVMVEICKSDMILLNSLDQNQVAVADYMVKLKQNLQVKQQAINDFINKLGQYEQLLEQEAELNVQLKEFGLGNNSNQTNIQ